MIYVFYPDAEDIGERLDIFLSAQFPEKSRSYIQKLIKEGHAKKEEQCLKANYRLAEEDSITIEIPEETEAGIPAEDIPLDILYEDEDLLVLNKPRGMVVHPAAGHREGTLVNALLYHCRDQLSGINGVLRPGIVHRIDKDTTGSLVVCKNDFAHRQLAEQFAVHSITRKYRAICIGPITENLRIEGNIGRHPVDRKKMALLPEGKGRPAITLVEPLRALQGCTELSCQLLTGRTHQIRVHLSSVQRPILGDPVYGPKKSPVGGLAGQMLHAEVLGFVHPRSGEYLEFSAPLPDDFIHVLEKLGK